ncbi:DUF3630 family protein [Shewanella sp. YIC-542]|uniref:DUF3630 family protein n=1 Tax=Shewanella mytili TaxID=3377111 RepID=UPI00398F4987
MDESKEDIRVRLDRQAQTLFFSVTCDFEQFPQLAARLCQCLDLQVVAQEWGADRHQWLVEFEGTRLWLHFESYSTSCWLSCQQPQDMDVLQYLQTLWESQQ